MSNLFLASLSRDDYSRIEPHLEAADLPLKFYPHRAGPPIEYCHFPERGTSLCELVRLPDGSEVEAGIIGREGVVGLAALLPCNAAPCDCIVQVPGRSLRIRANILREQIAARPAILERAFRFAMELSIQVTQTAVCNVRHPLNKRLARWILMVHDRAEISVLPLTHEVLSIMLGVRRAGVSVAAHELSENGAIRYTRGTITIVDRQKLEESCCECYAELKTRIDRSLHPPARSPVARHRAVAD